MIYYQIERETRIIVESARTMLRGRKLKKFWTETVNTAVQVLLGIIVLIHSGLIKQLNQIHFMLLYIIRI